jgi:hypothetical protein
MQDVQRRGSIVTLPYSIFAANNIFALHTEAVTCVCGIAANSGDRLFALLCPDKAALCGMRG